jgi:hypothetical protein
MTGAMASSAACTIIFDLMARRRPLLSPGPNLIRCYAMLNKSDLQRQVGSLDLLISAISSEMVLHPEQSAESESAGDLMKEMQEALDQLRQARGLRIILLTALENEWEKSMANNQAANETRRDRRVNH